MPGPEEVPDPRIAPHRYPATDAQPADGGSAPLPPPQYDVEDAEPVQWSVTPPGAPERGHAPDSNPTLEPEDTDEVRFQGDEDWERRRSNKDGCVQTILVAAIVVLVALGATMAYYYLLPLLFGGGGNLVPGGLRDQVAENGAAINALDGRVDALEAGAGGVPAAAAPVLSCKGRSGQLRVHSITKKHHLSFRRKGVNWRIEVAGCKDGDSAAFWQPESGAEQPIPLSCLKPDYGRGTVFNNDYSVRFMGTEECPEVECVRAPDMQGNDPCGQAPAAGTSG